MKKIQKLVKYFSMTLAFVLAVFMIDMFVQILFSVAGSISGWDSDTVDEKKEFVNEIIDSFQVEAGNCSVKIETSNTNAIQIYTNKDNISVRAIGRTIFIKSDSWFSFSDGNARVRIVVPQNLLCHEINVKVGLGQISVENIKSEKLCTNISVGHYETQNINVKKTDALLGIGDARIQGAFDEIINAEVAIGELMVENIGDLNQYTIHAESEIGNVEINTKTFKEENWKQGNKKMNLDCGLGDIQILNQDAS